MRNYLTAVDGDLRKWAEAHPVCSRFLEIPGIGPLCAVSFYTAIEDPNRFNSAADVGPYLGLTPKVLQSGISLKHGPISKMGNKLTRSHLVSSATVIFAGRIKDHPLKIWGLKLAQRAGASKARVAVARRMAVTMLAMWKNGTRYEAYLPSARVSD
jgi:transposase